MGGVVPRVVAQNGHAHNDYLHPRPLWLALENGFRSIEVDVYLRHDELRVAHLPWQTRPARTLASLYFAPLYTTLMVDTAQPNPQRLLAHTRPLRLLIDCKTAGPETHAAVLAEMARYPELFAPSIGFQSDSALSVTITPPPVYVVFTGNCRGMCAGRTDFDIRTEVGDTLRPSFAAESRCPVELMSLKWGRYFKWKGRGPMPEAERALLRHLSSGRFVGQLRLYAAPDTPEAWFEFRAARVPWINTDRLADFARWQQAVGGQ